MNISEPLNKYKNVESLSIRIEFKDLTIRHIKGEQYNNLQKIYKVKSRKRKKVQKLPYHRSK